MNLKKFYIVFLSSAFLFVSLTAYVSKNKSLTKVFGKSEIVNVSNKDVIKFNHELHASKDVGLACKDCHKGAFESSKATDNLNPQKSDCAGCHDVKDQKNCNFCHYDGVFKKLGSSNKELVFSHKKHVGQKMECNVCHNGIDKVKFAAGAPNGGFPKMESCYSCHDGNKQVNELRSLSY